MPSLSMANQDTPILLSQTAIEARGLSNGGSRISYGASIFIIDTVSVKSSHKRLLS